MPNAGLRVGWGKVYVSEFPEYMAKSLKEFVTWGVSVVGGMLRNIRRTHGSDCERSPGSGADTIPRERQGTIQSLEPSQPSRLRRCGNRAFGKN